MCSGSGPGIGCPARRSDDQGSRSQSVGRGGQVRPAGSESRRYLRLTAGGSSVSTVVSSKLIIIFTYKSHRAQIQTHRSVSFYLTAHPETEALVLSGDSTNHSHRANAKRFPELDGLLFNLLGQLTSRSQDDSIRTLIRVLNPAA